MAAETYPSNKWLRRFIDIHNWSYDEQDGVLSTGNQKYAAGKFESCNITELEAMLDKNHPGPEESGLTYQIIPDADVTKLIINAKEGEVFQVASQLNALEMIDPTKTPEDDIEIYALDCTQGPRAAMACLPGLFVRNYYGEYNKFNALHNLNIHPKNGYLLWDDDPQSVLDKLVGNENKIRIPYMKNTQVIGVSPINPAKVERIEQDKYIHQVFTSSAPVDRYENGGDIQLQNRIAKILLKTAYRVCIGLSYLLRQSGKRVKCNLTLLGGGAFGNDMSDICSALRWSLSYYRNYPIDIFIHIREDPTYITSLICGEKLKWSSISGPLIVYNAPGTNEVKIDFTDIEARYTIQIDGTHYNMKNHQKLILHTLLTNDLDGMYIVIHCLYGIRRVKAFRRGDKLGYINIDGDIRYFIANK